MTQYLEINRQLGKGDLGTVYLCRGLVGSGWSAVKVTSKHEVLRRRKLQRIYNEYCVLNLQMLEYPFIVHVDRVMATPNFLLSCMTPYTLGPLHRAVLAKAPGMVLGEDMTRFVVAEIILALEFLHQFGIIHRDVKPENIFVRNDGHVVLADFDLCHIDETPNLIQRFAASGVSSPSSTSSREASERPSGQRKRKHSFVGTPEYMAPEVICDEAQTPAVDVWALGVLIYECITGTTPFKGHSDHDTLHKIRNGMSVAFPPGTVPSNSMRDLLEKVLVRRVERRMRLSELKAHPWFEGIDFRCLPSTTSPLLHMLLQAPAVSEHSHAESMQQCLTQELDRSRGEDTDYEDPFCFFDSSSRDISFHRPSHIVEASLAAGCSSKRAKKAKSRGLLSRLFGF